MTDCFDGVHEPWAISVKGVFGYCTREGPNGRPEVEEETLATATAQNLCCALRNANLGHSTLSLAWVGMPFPSEVIGTSIWRINTPALPLS